MLATVFGDVHDIGKNLVNTILTNNGYTVHDLGKQVPMNAILEKAVEVDADAIGLSALLVSTCKQMPICVQEQDARGLQFPVIVGGAAINRDFGRRIALLDEGERYFEPGLFYAKDAFEGLDIMDAVYRRPDAREAFVERCGTKRSSNATARATPSRTRRRSRHRTSKAISRPSRAAVLGPADARDIDLRRSGRASTSRASTGSPGARRTPKAPSSTGSCATSSNRGCSATRRWRYAAILIQPRVVYGYFPAAGDGDDVIVYDPEDRTREVARFRFTRQIGGEHLCLADYLREPHNGGASDVIALQVVTAGTRSSERTEALQAAGDYSESYFLHGFSVQSAEALAEWSHRRIRRELGLATNRQALLVGLRRLSGSRAARDVFRLLDARTRSASLDRGFPDHARAVDRRDRDASPASGVLQRRRDQRVSSLVGYALQWAKRRAPGSV